MSDLSVSKVSPVDIVSVRKVLSSSQISMSEKLEFVEKNKSAIKNTLGLNITPNEFKTMLANRPLIKFKPIRNSFTKRGDKALLARALGIPVDRVNNYLNTVTEDIKQVEDLNFLPTDKMDTIKSYIYRHGSKEQVVLFLDYELETSKDFLKTLYSTLEYNTGGVADYFVRPIHRLNNETLIKIYNTIDEHIASNEKSGNISQTEASSTAFWALKQIYQIQNNQKFLNAIKTQNALS